MKTFPHTFASPNKLERVCRVQRKTQSKKVCRVPDKKLTAKPSLPSGLVVGGASNRAAHGKVLCVFVVAVCHPIPVVQPANFVVVWIVD